jgi:hypothetical protein
MTRAVLAKIAARVSAPGFRRAHQRLIFDQGRDALDVGAGQSAMTECLELPSRYPCATGRSHAQRVSLIAARLAFDLKPRRLPLAPEQARHRIDPGAGKLPGRAINKLLLCNGEPSVVDAGLQHVHWFGRRLSAHGQGQDDHLSPNTALGSNTSAGFPAAL